MSNTIASFGSTLVAFGPDRESLNVPAVDAWSRALADAGLDPNRIVDDVGRDDLGGGPSDSFAPARDRDDDIGPVSSPLDAIGSDTPLGTQGSGAVVPIADRGEAAQVQDREVVAGPGPARNWFGLSLNVAPRQSEGMVPGAANLDWSVDRDTGTLNFYRRHADAGRTPVRSLQVQGERVLMPDGQVVGRLRADGGFELDRSYLDDLRMCALPGIVPAQSGFSPVPPLPTLPGYQAPTVPRLEAGGLSPTPALPHIEQGPAADGPRGPQVMSNQSPPWTPSDVRSRVPPGWGDGAPTKKGEGWRWTDPEDQDNSVRIDRGDPNNSQPIR